MKISKIFLSFSLIFLVACNISNIEHQKNNNYIHTAISTENLFITNKNISDISRGNALIIAVANNNLKIIKLLLEEKTESNYYENISPYFFVKSMEVLRLLIENGYDTNLKNEDNETILEYYLKNRPLKFSKFLLKNSKDLLDIPVFEIVKRGDLEILNMAIEKGANFTTVDSEGNYPIFYSDDDAMTLRLLDFDYNIKKLNNRRENILGEVYLKALEKNNTKLLNKLLQKGIDRDYLSYKTKNNKIYK